MPVRLTPIAPVLLGVVIYQVGLGIMTPLIPLLLLRAGASSPAIGAVASAYFIGFLAGALTVHRVVTRVGHIRAFATFASLGANATLLMLFFDGPVVAGLLRLVVGYGSAGLSLVAESWLNDRADASTRGRIFGAYLVASWGASVLGPLVLSVVAASPQLYVLAGMAFALSLLPMALTHESNPRMRRGTHLNLWQLYRISPVGVVCCLAAGLLNSAYYPLVPVYLQRHGYATTTVGGFVSVISVAGLLVQYPVGMLSDRFGRRRIIIVILVAGFLLAGLMDLIEGSSLTLLTVLGFLLAGMMAPLYGLGAGQTNDRMQRGEYVAASGGLLFAWSLGSSIGPSIAGEMMGRTGPSGLFAYLAVTLGALAVFTGARMLLRAEVPRAERGAFVPAAVVPPRHTELASAVATAADQPGADAPVRRVLP
jgi:MFS family permease